MFDMNHTHCTPARAQSVWQALPGKARASVVGQSLAHIITLLDDTGYVPLSTVLAALYPDLSPEQARSALSTQIVNRAYTSDSGQVPLRLCVSRKNKLSTLPQRVWLEGASTQLPSDAALDTPRYENATFTGGLAQAITGKDFNKELSKPAKKPSSKLVETPPNEALHKATLQAAHIKDKTDLNTGRPNPMHGLQTIESLGTGSSRSDAAAQGFVATAAAASLGFDSIGKTVTCLNAMLDWAGDTSPKAPRLLALLGDYGAGKTSHAMQLDRVLGGLVPPPTSVRAEPVEALASIENTLRQAQGERLVNNRRMPQPAFIDLALLAGVDNLAYLSLQDLLTVALNKRRSSGAGVNASTLIAMARAGEVVMLYDGLDELLKHNDGYGLHNLLDQLLRVLDPDPTTGKASKAKIMVSCRTHYFRDLQSQHAFFDTRRRGVAQANDYLCLSLLPWNAQTVESYLNKRLKPSDASELLRIIQTTYNLEELASKPLLLAMMAEQVNQLLAENTGGQTFTASRLYGITVAECIKRDFGKHTIKPQHKPLIMGALATAMWNDNAEQWSANKLDAWLARAVPALFPNQYTTVDMGAMQDDLRTATFIVRTSGRGDDFNFSHRSFMEYFIARWIWDCTQNQHDGVFDESVIRNYLPHRDLNAESTQFARELWQAQYNNEAM